MHTRAQRSKGQELNSQSSCYEEVKITVYINIIYWYLLAKVNTCGCGFLWWGIYCNKISYFLYHEVILFSMIKNVHLPNKMFWPLALDQVNEKKNHKL